MSVSVVALWPAYTQAQTSPSAAALPLTLNSLSTSTLPTGVAIHRFSSIPATRTVLPASGGDLPNQGASPSGTAGGWYHLGSDGIGLLSSGSNPAGALVIAVNSSGQTNLTVSWTCKTVKNQSARDNSVALQYRIGTSGNFTNVGTASTYSTSGKADGHVSPVYTETLPSLANNQSVVQIRWLYWELNSGSGSRDKVAIDDVSILGSAGVVCNPPAALSASSITSTSVTLNWSASSSATSYEWAVTSSSSPPAFGTGTTALSQSVAGLTANTQYYAHVRSLCPGSTFSGWTTSGFVTAPAEPAADSDFVLMTYNLLNYPGSTGATREPFFRTIVNGVNPDILVVQELSSAAGVSSFLNNVLNYTGTSYSAGSFIDGPDSDNGIYFKDSLFTFVSHQVVQTTLRNISAFRLRHLVSGDTLIIYSVHLKASNSQADEDQRADEVDSLRKVTNALPAGKAFVVCGDFNIYGSSEPAYQKLVQQGSNATGRFYDVLSLSGIWNNPGYAVHQTQSPRVTAFGGGATGGIDDRFDMILFSDTIVQSGGYDVVGGSYRVFGNDGLHYNQALNTPPYNNYDSTTADALHNASDHLPVCVKINYTRAAGSKAGANTITTSLLSSSPANRLEHLISVFPNPSDGLLYVRSMTQIADVFLLEVHDASGRVVRTANLRGMQPDETTMIHLAGLPNGVYFLQSASRLGAIKLILQ